MTTKLDPEDTTTENSLLLSSPSSSSSSSSSSPPSSTTQNPTRTQDDDTHDHDPPSKPPMPSVWKWVSLYIFLPTLIFKSCQRATIPVLPVLIRSNLDGTDSQIGLVLASVGLGKLLGNLPSGQLVAVGGSPLGLQCACALLALAWLGAAVATSVPSLLVASYLEGVGLALWQVARQTLVTEQISIHHGRGKIQATVGGLERFAAVVGPTLGGWLATHYGLTVPFVVKALCMVANGLLLFYLFHVGGCSQRTNATTTTLSTTTERGTVTTSTVETGVDQMERVTTNDDTPDADKATSTKHPSHRRQDSTDDNTESVHDFGRNMHKVLSNHGKDLQQIAVWAILFPIARETRTFLFPLWAMNLGYGPHAIGLMTSLTFVVDTALVPLSGYLTDTYGRKYCGVPAGLLMALSYLLAPVVGCEFWSLTAISIVGGIGNGLSGGVVNSVGSDMAPRHHRALFLSSFRIVSDLGILLGPLVSGLVAQQTHAWWGGMQPAFWLIAALSALSSLYMAWVLPETRWQPPPNGPGGTPPPPMTTTTVGDKDGSNPKTDTRSSDDHGEHDAQASERLLGPPTTVDTYGSV